MRISIYNPDMVKVADIGDKYISCLWREDYNGDGAFSLELRATDVYKTGLAPDCYAKRQDRPGVMVIKTINAADGKIVLSGRSAASQLDDVAFVGKIKADSVVASALYDAYENSTKYRNITFAPVDLPDTYGGTTENMSFHEMMQSMCVATDLGYRAVKAGGGIEIQLFKPAENANAKFSHFLGNLKDVRINRSSVGFKNYAIVLGETSSGTKKRVNVDMSEGGQRREVIISGQIQDADETESAFTKRLREIGRNRLAENREELNCSFTPSAAGFGSLFELGDIATIILDDYGLKLQARIISFSEKSQNNKSETTIEVGTPTIISR